MKRTFILAPFLISSLSLGAQHVNPKNHAHNVISLEGRIVLAELEALLRVGYPCTDITLESPGLKKEKIIKPKKRIIALELKSFLAQDYQFRAAPELAFDPEFAQKGKQPSVHHSFPDKRARHSHHKSRLMERGNNNARNTQRVLYGKPNNRKYKK